MTQKELSNLLSEVYSFSDAAAPVDGLKENLASATEAVKTPKVEVPNIEPAKVELEEYQGFVDLVTQQVRGSLQQATSSESLPAPNFDTFKEKWSELPGFISEQIDAMKSAAGTSLKGVEKKFSDTGGNIVTEVSSWPGKIEDALGDLSGIGSTAGSALMSGLLDGMKSGEEAVLTYAGTLADKIAQQKGPLPYDERVLIPNGKALMTGLGVGMENGFQPVLDQAKDMAGRISEAFASGVDPTSALNGFNKTEINRMEKVLNLETKRLESQAKALAYQAKVTGNESLKAEADKLRLLKDELSLQKDMLDLAGEYNETVGGGEDPLVKAASGLMKSPVDFAKATGQQFLTDLGISGDGMISRAITEGISYVFQIGSVDEALSIKDREESKRALSVIGR